MKTKLLFLIMLLISISGSGTVWIITNTGDTYSPDNLTIMEGDTIIFQLSNDHNVIEVSAETWNNNGTTALPGGFITGFGGGTVLPDQLSSGIHYYICQPHAFLGMKGMIVVETATELDQEPLQPVFVLYPNPAIDQISIKTQIIGSPYRIADQAGKISLSGILNETTSTIDISHLPAGMYIFQTGQNDVNFPFIKK
jgi:plastocyanin